MSPKKILYIAITVLSFLFLLLLNTSYKQAVSFKRDKKGLLSRYHKLHDHAPISAANTLKILLQSYPENVFALEKLSRYFHNTDVEKECYYRKKLSLIEPNNLSNAIQLATILESQKKYLEASLYYQVALTKSSKNSRLEKKALLGIKTCLASVSFTNHHEQQLMDQVLFSAYHRLKQDKFSMANELLTLASYNSSIVFKQPYRNNELIASNEMFSLDRKESSTDAMDSNELLTAFDDETNTATTHDVTVHNNKKIIDKTDDRTILEDKKSAPLHAILQAEINSVYADLERYYRLKKYNKTLSYELIKELNKKSPNELTILREAGESAIANHHYKEAEFFLKHSYALAPSDELAMELGYLNQELGNTDQSINYFRQATHSKNRKLANTANQSINNLIPSSFGLIPSPYFSDLYFAPFYFSRFNLTVTPLIFRAGRELNNDNHLKLYFISRYTKDNRSRIGPQIDTIYEDNLWTYGLGMSLQPISSWPMIGFVEIGKAKDLIWRRRKRIRNDLRAGLTYGTYWQNIVYLNNTIKSPFIFDGEIYANGIFFSRYDNNFIVFSTLKESLTVAKYKNIPLKLFLMAQASVDTNREFYNNIFEWGPGVSLIIKNNLNMSFQKRFGYYFPIKTRTVNPYPSTYGNNVWQLNVYLKF